MRSDKGPWKDAKIMRMVQNGDHKCSKKKVCHKVRKRKKILRNTRLPNWRQIIPPSFLQLLYRYFIWRHVNLEVSLKVLFLKILIFMQPQLPMQKKVVGEHIALGSILVLP
ncbi:hypothetical protein AAZX31_01G042000 [Glycine max]|uniref:uncharacterized protein LOC114410897 n=1 Tax=Glycine soja TaxID=3848 RepID=UPI0003DE9720|nr:uncharacterized protein LOC114410897 [Glycine soja]XP_040861133.1 uncharacterized protein LOC102669670 [Glycine max]KAG4403147.1 hypothetical protein GLYMA_01G043951v4 [Glycine max]KAH1161577.1 hypothetical protein GYH30_000457 [Glycine max]